MLMCAQGWFAKYEAVLGENGYNSPPEMTYRSFVRFLRNNGKVLELGCGNGLLLRYLCDQSSRILIPFGVDINSAAIKTARDFIHPGREYAFVTGDVAEFDFPDALYQTIIANPLYVNQGYLEQGKNGNPSNIISRYYDNSSVSDYVTRCLSNLAPGGRLILWCYAGQLNEINDYKDLFFRDIFRVGSLLFTEEPTISIWTLDKPI